MLEHRYIMEKHLNRRLKTDEVVHHKNHDRLDNRLCNLEVQDRAEHTAFHRAHRNPCIVCGSLNTGGASGLCGKHYMRVRQWAKRFDVEIPSNKFARAIFYMGVGSVLDNSKVENYLLDLQLAGAFEND